MTSRSVGRSAHWVPATIVVATLIISAVRGLGHAVYGPLPALGRLEAIKFIDPLLVLAFGGFTLVDALLRRARVFPVWKVRWAVATVGVVTLGVVSALWTDAPAYYAAQSLWFVLRPAVLLLVLTGCWWDGRLRPWLIGVIVAFTLANAAVVLAEWLVLRASGPGYSADGIIGLLHDAHQQATFAYTIALLGLAAVAAASSWSRRLAGAAFVALNVFVGFVSQGQKATGIEAVVLVAAFAVLVFRSRRRLVRVVTLVPAAALAAFLVLLMTPGNRTLTSAAELLSGNLEDRLAEGGYRGLAFVNDLGVVQMFQAFWSLSGTDASTLVLGVGPSNFGSPAAMTRLDRGDASTAIRDLFWWEGMKEAELATTGELRLLGLSAKTSLPGVVIGEYGAIAFLLFVYLLLWPLFIRDPAGREDAGRAGWGSPLFWVKVAYGAVVVQAAISTLGAWDNDVVLTLLFVGFASALTRR